MAHFNTQEFPKGRVHSLYCHQPMCKSLTLPTLSCDPWKLGIAFDFDSAVIKAFSATMKLSSGSDLGASCPLPVSTLLESAVRVLRRRLMLSQNLM